MEKSTEEWSNGYFRMSKYGFDELLCRITPYIQHQNTNINPVGVLQRPAEALRIPQSHPFLRAYIFFSSASRALFHLHGNDRTLGSADQSKCETNQEYVGDVASFDRCKIVTRHILTSFFNAIFVSRHRALPCQTA